METLVATVLIIVIFLISSMVMNSIFSNSLKQKHTDVSTRLHELQYKFQNGAIMLPYFEEFNSWEISVLSERKDKSNVIIFRGIDKITNNSLEYTKVDK